MAAGEVHPRAERDHRQLRSVALQCEQPVGDLVQRSVAADRDDLFRAVAGRLGDELREMTGAFGEERDALEAALRRAVRDLRPAAPGGPVVGGRIDEEDRANGQR
jgi:hypothetical protein